MLWRTSWTCSFKRRENSWSIESSKWRHFSSFCSASSISFSTANYHHTSKWLVLQTSSLDDKGKYLPRFFRGTFPLLAAKLWMNSFRSLDISQIGQGNDSNRWREYSIMFFPEFFRSSITGLLWNKLFRLFCCFGKTNNNIRSITFLSANVLEIFKWIKISVIIVTIYHYHHEWY